MGHFRGQWFTWSHITIQAFKLGKILSQLVADSPCFSKSTGFAYFGAKNC